jgi:hypothetical protein
MEQIRRRSLLLRTVGHMFPVVKPGRVLFVRQLSCGVARFCAVQIVQVVSVHTRVRSFRKLEWLLTIRMFANR